MYDQLLAISFIFKKRFDIYKCLLDKIEKSNEKLKSLIYVADDKLITTITQICDSSASSLNIPNHDEEQQSLLFESFKFWIFLLNANGKDHSIQIGLLKTLLESENYELINYFNAGYIDDENFINFINDDTLKLLRNKSNELSDIIEQLISFYNKYYDKTNDVQIYLEDL
ncbi:hypothetical protein C2G38_2237905 [Gigaspora rosea]|uniref:Uncharacterized protein n=1 Tax=Gigaspora rosea TaxID=44941 RepID=A0A397W9L9_9GLOM|nr:hypothetical protein C2G38_2237905 [Gigaspora rosea]